jgi:23S rRNA U2552 (ribose-2'-O)-methylase RlmE/FtsJ
VFSSSIDKTWIEMSSKRGDDMMANLSLYEDGERAQSLSPAPSTAAHTDSHPTSIDKSGGLDQPLTQRRDSTTTLLEADRPNEEISAYLLSRVPAFGRLSTLREQGWKSTAGDDHFKTLRSNADNATQEVSNAFFNQMVQNGTELQSATAGFKITRRVTHNSPPDTILEFGTAPGGFLHVALQVNPYANATAFTLPEENGGHPVRIHPKTLSARVDLHNADITLFAADMGVTSIPPSHPDAANFFLDRQIPVDTCFDLVICGAGVLRTHDRAEYREVREAKRLAVTQLALGLEHLREGGTLIMLLHKPEKWEVAQLLHAFDNFSGVTLFKPRRARGIRSSFYLVAKNVRSEREVAKDLVEQWKEEWGAATFGSDEDYKTMVKKGDDLGDVEGVLAEFGEKLGRLGKVVWEVQADALERQSWIK